MQFIEGMRFFLTVDKLAFKVLHPSQPTHLRHTLSILNGRRLRQVN